MDSQPRTNSATQPRTNSEVVQPRTDPVTIQLRANSVAVQPRVDYQPQTKPAVQPQASFEAVQPATDAATIQLRTIPAAVQPQTNTVAVQLRVGSEGVQQTNSAAQTRTSSEAVQPQKNPVTVQPQVDSRPQTNSAARPRPSSEAVQPQTNPGVRQMELGYSVVGTISGLSSSFVPESHTKSQTTFERLISNTLPTRDRIPLITSIFSDHDQVEILGNLCGDNAQSFIDVIDEVSARILHTGGTDWLIHTQTSASCRLGVRQPRITAPQEVSTNFAQDMWPASPAPEITGDSASLRSDRGTTVSWWIFGRVEVSIW